MTPTLPLFPCQHVLSHTVTDYLVPCVFSRDCLIVKDEEDKENRVNVCMPLPLPLSGEAQTAHKYSQNTLQYFLTDMNKHIILTFCCPN